MAMALTHGGFDDDFFSGFPLSALMHGHLRGSDGSAANRGIPLDVKEVSVKTGILCVLSAGCALERLAASTWHPAPKCRVKHAVYVQRKLQQSSWRWNVLECSGGMCVSPDLARALACIFCQPCCANMLCIHSLRSGAVVTMSIFASV